MTLPSPVTTLIARTKQALGEADAELTLLERRGGDEHAHLRSAMRAIHDAVDMVHRRLTRLEDLQAEEERKHGSE